MLRCTQDPDITLDLPRRRIRLKCMDAATKPASDRRSVVVRFCGASGDGMLLAGAQLTATSVALGNDAATFPG